MFTVKEVMAMATRAVTTFYQRREILHRKEANQTLRQIAAEMGLKEGCVHNWWRIGRDEGEQGLQRSLGRPAKGVLSTFHPRVRELLTQWRHEGRRWGAGKAHFELSLDSVLKKQRLPSERQIQRYWATLAPPRRPSVEPGPNLYPPGLLPQAAHERWQLDSKERFIIPGIGLVSTLNIRDEESRLTVASQTFAIARRDEPRSVSCERIQAVCRQTLAHWGLPDRIRTDRGPVFFDNKNDDPFPRRITLWWVGLGIQHELIERGKPHQNGTVERWHQTWYNHTVTGQGFADLGEVQSTSDHTLEALNTALPSRAKGCGGQPPLQAHPEALIPRRPYQPEHELALFDIQRVYDFLAQGRWTRQTSQQGQISLGGYPYYIGTAYRHQMVQVIFDPNETQFVVWTLDRTEIKRLDPKGLSVRDITGIDPERYMLPSGQYVLPLPAFAVL
jgi:transposase InsO family protein